MRNRIRWSQRQVAVCFPLSGVTALFGYVSLHVCVFFKHSSLLGVCWNRKQMINPWFLLYSWHGSLPYIFWTLQNIFLVAFGCSVCPTSWQLMGRCWMDFLNWLIAALASQNWFWAAAKLRRWWVISRFRQAYLRWPLPLCLKTKMRWIERLLLPNARNIAWWQGVLLYYHATLFVPTEGETTFKKETQRVLGTKDQTLWFLPACLQQVDSRRLFSNARDWAIATEGVSPWRVAAAWAQWLWCFQQEQNEKTCSSSKDPEETRRQVIAWPADLRWKNWTRSADSD